MHLVKGRAAGEFVFRTVNGFDENGDYIFKYELNESEEPSSLRPITKKNGG